MTEQLNNITVLVPVTQRSDCIVLTVSFYIEKIFILAVLDLHCCMGFSPVAVSRGCSLVAVCGFLIAVASLVAKHGLYGTRALVVGTPRL